MKAFLNKTAYTKDLEHNRVVVEREFQAGIDRVWRAWTDSEQLDQWWGPKPYKAETKSMDFRVGGTWLYSMVGPDGGRHWGREDFLSISKPTAFETKNSFCDEEGNPNPSIPARHWSVTFAEVGSATRVTVEIICPSAETLERLLEMGFKEGFAAAHENLDALLAASGE
ncbi:MAG: SRPBCC domain-containing protein [Candidatus Hydrogenedentes bacterium]|nr:SRPBCC domain-containing protein [Candidatus Hydrogenedentota bacterium]